VANTTILTPELTRKVCKYIKQGSYLHIAAKRAGIGANTLGDWLRRGGKGEEPYKAFADAMDEAEAVCEQSLVRTIKVASRDDYRAAVYMLSCKFPDRWHRDVKAAADAAVKKSTARIINMLAKTLPAEQYEKALHAIAGIDDCAEEACADALTASGGAQDGLRCDTGEASGVTP
jgi:hypothetical protein